MFQETQTIAAMLFFHYNIAQRNLDAGGLDAEDSQEKVLSYKTLFVPFSFRTPKLTGLILSECACPPRDHTFLLLLHFRYFT
eukprot:2012885-Amphidinium_carterae.2